MSTIRHILLFTTLSIVAAGCAVVPAEGTWDLAEVVWEGDCDANTLLLAPVSDHQDIDITLTDDGIVFDTGFETISCAAMGASYVCDPVVVFDFHHEDAEAAEDLGANLTVTATYTVSFRGSHRATFEVELVGACEGDACTSAEEMMAGYGLTFVCSARGTQWAGLAR